MIFDEKIYEEKKDFLDAYTIQGTSRVYNLTIKLNKKLIENEKLPNPEKIIFSLKHHLSSSIADIPSTINSTLSSAFQRHPRSTSFIVDVKRATAFEKFKCPVQITVYNEQEEEDQVFELSSYIALANKGELVTVNLQQIETTDGSDEQRYEKVVWYKEYLIERMEVSVDSEGLIEDRFALLSYKKQLEEG